MKRLIGNFGKRFGTELACACQDKVFNLPRQRLIADSLSPTVIHTLFHMHTYADVVRTQFTANNKNCQFDAFIWPVSQRIPFGDNGAAERIDICKRDK